MSMQAKLRRLAQAEFGDAVDWYEAQCAGRGASFAKATRAVLKVLAATPELYPEVFDGVREAVVRGYPYAVYFRIGRSAIDVIAVYHTSRDPTVWQTRAGLPP